MSNCRQIQFSATSSPRAAPMFASSNLLVSCWNASRQQIREAMKSYCVPTIAQTVECWGGAVEFESLKVREIGIHSIDKGGAW